MTTATKPGDTRECAIEFPILWNGYLLSTVVTVLNRAGNFFWKGMRSVVQLLDAPYQKGVKVLGNGKTKLEQRLQRASDLHWWDITIHPKLVCL